MESVETYIKEQAEVKIGTVMFVVRLIMSYLIMYRHDPIAKWVWWEQNDDV